MFTLKADGFGVLFCPQIETNVSEYILKGISMPRVSLNQTAPDFSLADFSGKPFQLTNLRGQKNVLLVFNRTFA